MMKLTFELVAATDVTTFNKLVNERLTQGYRFMSGHSMTVTPHEDTTGHGLQYSAPMLLEEEV